MSKKLFSDKEISKLAKNKNILKISNKSITYTFEFKKKFIEEYNLGKLPRIIFKKVRQGRKGRCVNKSEVFEIIKLIVEKYKLKSKIKFCVFKRMFLDQVITITLIQKNQEIRKKLRVKNPKN